ncbi:MAG TPA: metallophosphoesterase, partial [Terriglobales bacterium]|nr:metallophosphoesterase [Terriglobales bacterium]
ESYWSSEWFAFSYANMRNLTANLPYAGSMGNHETYPTGQTSLFPKYFPYPFAGGRYYSFDYGPTHVTVLDMYPSGSTGTFDTLSAQGIWFKNDLATTTKPWKFVVFHEPGWSASNSCGTGHPNNTYAQQQIEPICERYGVAAVFNGHNHYYARCVVNGIQHVTTGGGGAPLNTGCTGQPNEVAYVSAYEYCKVAIDGGVMHMDAINRTGGTVIDSFTITRVIPDLTPPAVTLTSPVGGEDWKAGSSHAITWTATDAVGVTAVDLAYSMDSGASFPDPIATGIANSGTYPWTVPNTPGDHVRVRAVAHDAAGNLGADSSASDLRISTWTITADGGPGGTVVPSGTVPVVEGASQRFSIAPAAGHAVETLTVDGGPVAPDTTYTFTNVTADHTLNATFADTTAPVVHVTSPVGGERWDIGTLQTITWTASGATAVDSVNVDFSSVGPSGPWLPVAHGLDNTGSVPWTVPGPASDDAIVRVTAYDHAMHVGWDTSDSLFHIIDPNAAVEGGPAVLALARPSPNPAPGSTALRFSLPAAGHARLEILDLAGRRLWRYEANLGSGDHTVRWSGANDSGGRVGAGLYFVRLVTPWGTRTQRLALLP